MHYPFLVTTGTRTFIRGPLERLDILIQFIIQFIFPDPPPLFKTVLEDISIIVMAVVIVGFASWASRERPQWGLKPLLWIGGGAIFGLIIYQVATSEERGSIWPLVVGGIVFLYLWWLAALIFDLTFTWHKYIRHAEGRERLDEYKNRINQDIRRVPQTAAT